MILPRQIFERLSFRFRNQERRTQATNHEQGKDLHHLVQPLVVASAILQWAYKSLRNYSTEVAGTGRYAVGCRAETSSEDFARYCSRVSRCSKSTHSKLRGTNRQKLSSWLQSWRRTGTARIMRKARQRRGASTQSQCQRTVP